MAVVAAGIVHAIERDREQSPAFQLQIVSSSTWSVILYILNGLVFVLLGLQIPSVMNEIFKNPAFDNFVVIRYILIITTSLLLLRFVWLYAAWWFGWKSEKSQISKPSARTIALTTISGVRGAVTLAGAFSIPYVLADGSPFPERSLIIFIAAGVILVTLVAASILLPILAKTDKDRSEEKREAMEKSAKIHTYDAAISSVRALINDDNREAALAVVATYKHKRNHLKHEGNAVYAATFKKIEIKIRMKALDAEAKYIAELKKEERIDKETIILLEEHIHRMRIAVTNRFKYRSMIILTLFRRTMYRLTQLFVPNKLELRKIRKVKTKRMIRLKMEMSERAIASVKEGITPQNDEISLLIISEYTEMITKFKIAKNLTDSNEFTRSERELQNKAFQAERNEVQNLYESGSITIEVARQLRKQINIREAYWIEETSMQH